MPKFNIKRNKEISAEIAVEVYEQKIERIKEQENEDAIQRAHENKVIKEPVIATPKEKIKINEIIAEIIDEEKVYPFSEIIEQKLIRTVFSMHNKDTAVRISIPSEMGLKDKDKIKFERKNDTTIVMHKL